MSRFPSRSYAKEGASSLRPGPEILAQQTQTIGKPVSLGDKLVVRALAIGFHARESPGLR